MAERVFIFYLYFLTNNRERESVCVGFFLELTTERVYWKMKKEGNEKAKWHLGQNNRGIHWSRYGQLKGLLR